jgi:hypothetical protein
MVVMVAGVVRAQLLAEVAQAQAALAGLLAAEDRRLTAIAAHLLPVVAALLVVVAALCLALAATEMLLAELVGLVVAAGARHHQTKVRAKVLAAQAVMARSFCCGLRGTNHEIRMD